MRRLGVPDVHIRPKRGSSIAFDESIVQLPADSRVIAVNANELVPFLILLICQIAMAPENYRSVLSN